MSLSWSLNKTYANTTYFSLISGYLGVLTSVFTPNINMYEGLREKGFCMTATWPNAGKVSRQGTVDNYLMYRQFHGEEIQGKVGHMLLF